MGSDPEDLLYGVRVSVYVRMFIMACILVEVNYRVDYGAMSHILNNLYVLAGITFNGYVFYRMRSEGTVDSRWLLALSFLDVAMISFSVSMSGGFDSRYFVVYYLAVVFFAAAFPSPLLCAIWVTMVASTYVAVGVVVGQGMDMDAYEDKVLLYRLGVLYGVAGIVNLMARIEQKRRRDAIDREREIDRERQDLDRQRIEFSQAIHDTTAQSAYMVDLGVGKALELVDRSDEVLLSTLEATAKLSKSTIWELRHPIDAGRIFQGVRLAHVLEMHAETFTAITAVPAEVVQTGTEPDLSTVERSLLFSIAHNALTNAFRHSQAREVLIRLRFESDRLCLSVSDDGIGLPNDYASRGHGFRNMREEAARMGGMIEVGPAESGTGTTVSCIFPHSRGD